MITCQNRPTNILRVTYSKIKNFRAISLTFDKAFRRTKKRGQKLKLKSFNQRKKQV